MKMPFRADVGSGFFCLNVSNYVNNYSTREPPAYDILVTEAYYKIKEVKAVSQTGKIHTIKVPD